MARENVIPVIVLFGPTASGKTEFLLNFKNISEIISIDSMQVYRYMDIGTAKPEKKITDEIKHHLIDIIEPDMEFTTWDFVKNADFLCRDIYDRGKIPVVSGGNAFTLKNFIYGLPDTPKPDFDIRDKILYRLETEGLQSLAEELEQIDPQYCSRISMNDKYRIARALEIFYSTGKPVSEYAPHERVREMYDFFIAGLARDRADLYERINGRVDLMFEKGLLEEFKKLVEMGYKADDPGMCGIGYREFFQLHNSNCTGLEEIKELIKKNTRHYAKRQITFFKKIKNVMWENPENHRLILEKAEQFLSGYGKTL